MTSWNKKTKIRRFKGAGIWVWPLLAGLMGFSFFSGQALDPPGRIFAVPDRTVAPPIVRPVPERAPKPLPPPAISPLLVYVAAYAQREITAYNAGDVAQCDQDPCISASGEDICKALEKGYKRCAANFVPLGTRLWIQGIGECLVTDRMHPRFSHRVDIAMPITQKKEALAFGRKIREVKVISHL